MSFLCFARRNDLGGQQNNDMKVDLQKLLKERQKVRADHTNVRYFLYFCSIDASYRHQADIRE